MSRLPRVLLPLTLAASAAAQSSWITLPNYYTLHEAPVATEALAGPARFQQVHSDYKGVPGSLRALLLRRDGLTPGSSDHAARTLTLEVALSHANRATLSTTFASNYKTPATIVFPQANVNTPDYTTIGATVPTQPWPFEIAFQTPFAYNGSDDLLFEVRVAATSAPGKSLPLDAADASGIAYGSSSRIGTGCATPLGTLTLGSRMTYDRTLPTVRLDFAASAAPASGALALLVGATNPNVTIPGLCAKLYTDAQIVIAGTADAQGTYATPPYTIPVTPFFYNEVVYSQLAAPLASQAGIPIVVSNGLRTRGMSTPPATLATTTLQASGSPTAATGTLAVGSALVVTFEFQ